MSHVCSLTLELSGKNNTWYWQCFHRTKFTENVFEVCHIHDDVSPNEIHSSFHESVTILDTFQFQKLGTHFCKKLFPQKLISRIKMYRSGDIMFRVPSDWADIPFEICYIPQKGFLGQLFQIGTVVKVKNDKVNVNNKVLRENVSSQYDKILILADPADNLPSAHSEGMKLKEFSKKHGIMTHLIAHGEKIKIIDAIVRSSYVHFAGHSSTTGDVKTTGWELCGKEYFNINDIVGLANNPSLPWLVFSNSCHAANCYSEQCLAGIAGAFLKAGIPQFQRSRLKAKNQHLTRHLRKSTYRTFQ